MTDLIVDFPNRQRSRSFDCTLNSDGGEGFSPSSNEKIVQPRSKIKPVNRRRNSSKDSLGSSLSSSKQEQQGNTRYAKKSVYFARTMDVTFIERRAGMSTEYKDSIWYSQRDYRAMKLANKHAVLGLHKRFRSSQSTSSTSTSVNDGTSISNSDNVDVSSGSSSINEAESTVLTGLERLLTPKIIKKSAFCRRQCWKAVLDEQDRQEQEWNNHHPTPGNTSRQEMVISPCHRDSCHAAQDALARASIKITEWAVKRAHTTGMLNAATAD